MAKVSLNDVICKEYFQRAHDNETVEELPYSQQPPPAMLTLSLPNGEVITSPVQGFVAINGNYVTYPSTYEDLDRDLGIMYCNRSEGYWVFSDEKRFFATTSYKTMCAETKTLGIEPIRLEDEDEFEEFIDRMPKLLRFRLGFDRNLPQIGMHYEIPETKLK